MTSEEAFQQKFPAIVSILTGNGIVAGQYSVSTYTLPSKDGFGCWVSPTTGNSELFTQEVQNALIALDNVIVKIN